MSWMFVGAKAKSVALLLALSLKGKAPTNCVMKWDAGCVSSLLDACVTTLTTGSASPNHLTEHGNNNPIAANTCGGRIETSGPSRGTVYTQQGERDDEF